MIIGIDASNIRTGGGVTHLLELLNGADPQKHNIEQIIVYGGEPTLSRMPVRPDIALRHFSALDGNLASRLYWQQTKLKRIAKSASCDLLFVPGGTYLGSFRPFVTMSQNLLPFDVVERSRFKEARRRYRYQWLERSQSTTFRRADGVIFLTQYARQTVVNRTGALQGQLAIVPHGIANSFRLQARAPEPLTAYSEERPFRFLYVSIINYYKHQWHVAEAVGRLRATGLPVAVDFVGPAYEPALEKLNQAIQQWDPDEKNIRYLGSVPFADLPDIYHQADGFIFASSCENMPNILIEAMASGLPIACANREPMPEVLGGAGLYFDPENPDDIMKNLASLLAQPDVRAQLATSAYEKATQYSWQRCARETFTFLTKIATESIRT